MSIYFARKTNDPKNAPASFLAKSLRGYAPSSINQLSILGISRYPEVAYGMYRTHIDAFCYATKINSKVFAQQEGFDDVMDEETLLPFSHHPVVFSPAHNLSEDQAKSLLQKLGEGATMKYVGKTLEYTVNSPKVPLFNRYIQASSLTYTVGPDRLTPSGYKAYIKSCTLITAFLSTNYYPAYSTRGDTRPGSIEMTFGKCDTVDNKKKKYFYSYGSGNIAGEEAKEWNARYKRRKLADEVDQEGDVEMKEDEEAIFTEPKDVCAMTLSDMSSTVITAKPSGRPASTNYGGPGSCPELPGLVFPYFKGLNRPDFTTIRECFVTCFPRMFGKNYKELKENIGEMKTGTNNLSNTEAGLEITHLMKGILMALQTQTRLYALFDKSYCGFCLLGENFAIWDGSKWVDPVSHEELRAELANMDTHALALKELSEMLSDMEITRLKKASGVTSADISTSIKLIEEMCIRDFSDYPKQKEFDNCLQKLIWPEPYWQITPENLVNFLDRQFIELMPPSGSTSLYIPSCKAPYDSLLFKNLALFGPDAPSLWNTRGDIISVLPPSPQKGKSKEKVEAVPAPAEIIMLPKPLLVAYKDWMKTIKDGAVSMNSKERAKESRGHVIRNEALRNQIWDKLSKGLASAEEESREKSVAKKPKFVHVADADSLLDLF